MRGGFLYGALALPSECIYMRPQQDKPYDRKSDIWAFGCLLYELLTLRHAFEASSLPALIIKIIRANPPPISPSYSQPLRELVSQMLSRKVCRRFSNGFE